MDSLAWDAGWSLRDEWINVLGLGFVWLLVLGKAWRDRWGGGCWMERSVGSLIFKCIGVLGW